MTIVLKFGGSSLADADCVRRAAKRVAALMQEGNRVVVVVSAQGDTTDELLTAAAEITGHPHPRELDAFLAAGEQLSAGLMAMALGELGCPAVSLTGWQAGLRTDSIHGNARIVGLAHDRITRELDRGRAVVVAGFQGLNEEEDVTTLGRGGSDTTAVALAAFLRARECLIYTDVDGIYDRDPRVYPTAQRYDTIGYDQMLELVRAGAQVLHDRSVELGKEHGVPIRVLSSFRPGPGTLVTDM